MAIFNLKCTETLELGSNYGSDKMTVKIVIHDACTGENSPVVYVKLPSPHPTSQLTKEYEAPKGGGMIQFDVPGTNDPRHPYTFAVLCGGTGDGGCTVEM
jgi:hypothetical protein